MFEKTVSREDLGGGGESTLSLLGGAPGVGKGWDN